MDYSLYIVCGWSAITSAAVMHWLLRQRLSSVQTSASAMPPNQWRKTYLVHSAKAFTVVVATVAAERYVYAYVYTTFDLANSVRLLKCFHLFLNHGFWAYVLILLWDWAVAKAISSDPSRLPTLRRLAVTGVILYAILPSFGLWWVQTTILQAEARKPPIGDLWETTNRLAAAVRENPTYNLHTVEEHLVLTFSSPRAAYELYEIGEQQGIFPFRKRSYAGLQRWGALDNLLVALVEHARIAAKRGDWQRCRTALQLALRTMEKAAELQVPNDLKPRLDTRMVPVQSFALIHIRGGFERIYPLLKEIASWSPAHRHQMERALQQGRRVGDVLVEVGRKSRPLLGVQRQPAQRRQLEVIFDESMRRLSLQLLEWDYSIEDGLQRIWAMEQQKHTR